MDKSVFPRPARKVDIQVIVDDVELPEIHKLERKIANLQNTIKNDPLTQKTFDQKELDTFNTTLTSIQNVITQKTKDEKMAKVSYDALDNRLKVTLERFYLKHT